uniref:G_PROTEIN_RECEP_F1_2 domain-containing protein n=1 Tax=Macrostomum lignano TaxID=282301 RepID=A0A1I8IW19_9PLAT
HMQFTNLFDIRHLIAYFECHNNTAALQKLHREINEVERYAQRELLKIRPILFAFVGLIAFGAVGNGLLVAVVLRSSSMRKGVNNLLVANLAMSDFVLCVLTQPCNIRRLFFSTTSWTYGLALCKFVNALTGLNLFASTFAVTAIAIDRCRAVTQPLDRTLERRMRLALPLTWLAACLMSSPMLWFGIVTRDNTVSAGEDRLICWERTANEVDKTAKLAYSCVSMCVQYAAPLTVLLVAFVLIRQRLRRRLLGGNESAISLTATQTVRVRAEHRRQRRANILLASVVVTFGLAWLPLSASNLHSDYKIWQMKLDSSTASSQRLPCLKLKLKHGSSGFSVSLVQALCLLFVQTSACINPVLYGFLNENFRSEFCAMAPDCLRRRLQLLRPRSGANLEQGLTGGDASVGTGAAAELAHYAGIAREEEVKQDEGAVPETFV